MRSENGQPSDFAAPSRILGDDILQRRRLLVWGLELGHGRHIHGLGSEIRTEVVCPS